MNSKKSFLLIIFIGGLIIFLSECINTVVKNNDPRGNGYAGSASCRQCHQAIYDSYLITAHYNTTRASSIKNVLGNFHQGHNIFAYPNNLKIIMERRDSGLYEVLYVKGKEQEARRMDITFGIRHAQTFLYWEGNKTFELPISYYAAMHTWAASPSFSSSEVNFKRFVGKNCFECHSSYISNKLKLSSSGIEETLDKNSLLTGIDCERCHGPAANHVNYHLANPGVEQAKYMVSFRSLSRQQKLDACAVCHSGNDRQKNISTFEFHIGDTLANFFPPFAFNKNQNTDFDVHGNQYQLLSESKCFLKSKTLDCTTCHDPHTDASNNLNTYSEKCLSCHSNPEHRSLKLNAAMKSNCIDCHMPELPSSAITFQLQGSNQIHAYLLRTHKIAVYDKKD